MYRVFQEGTGYFVEIKDTDPPVGIGNVIPLHSCPGLPPADFPYLAAGSAWIEIDLVEAVTGGIFRYVSDTSRPGYFYTNILCKSASEAQERLRLQPPNRGDYQARFQIEPTRVMISYIPGSSDVQMVIADTGKVKLLGFSSLGSN